MFPSSKKKIVVSRVWYALPPPLSFIALLALSFKGLIKCFLFCKAFLPQMKWPILVYTKASWYTRIPTVTFHSFSQKFCYILESEEKRHQWWEAWKCVNLIPKLKLDSCQSLFNSANIYWVSTNVLAAEVAIMNKR